MSSPSSRPDISRLVRGLSVEAEEWAELLRTLLLLALIAGHIELQRSGCGWLSAAQVHYRFSYVATPRKPVLYLGRHVANIITIPIDWFESNLLNYRRLTGLLIVPWRSFRVIRLAPRQALSQTSAKPFHVEVNNIRLSIDFCYLNYAMQLPTPHCLPCCLLRMSSASGTSSSS